MRRREFITLLGGAAAVWPLAARAQQTGFRRIGVLLSVTRDDANANGGLAAFTKSLADFGWIEGRNIQIDYRWGAADVGRMQTFAKELVGLKPDLLVGMTTPATEALQNETRTIPIVFVVVSDPSRFVASLPRPGGNITGFINFDGSVSGKWIEILKDLAPDASSATLMYNPDTAPFLDYYLQPFEAAARSSGIESTTAAVRSAEEIERVVADLGNQGGAGLVVAPDAFMLTKRNLDVVIAAAARYRVATIYPFRFCVPAGGLISYGIDTIDLWRRSGAYVDRILKGVKPADLPVQLPTKFELAVNLKTAKALGVTVPPSLLAVADEVVE
jgi:putative ABC transport system substrate-binding protein